MSKEKNTPVTPVTPVNTTTTTKLVFESDKKTKKEKFRYTSKTIEKDVTFKLSNDMRMHLANYVSYNVEITREIKSVNADIKKYREQFETNKTMQEEAKKKGVSNDEAIRLYPLGIYDNKINMLELYKQELKKALNKKCDNVYTILYSGIAIFPEYCKFVNNEKNSFGSLVAKVLNNIGIQDKKPNAVTNYAKNKVIPYIGVKDKTVVDTKRLTTAKTEKALYKTLTNVLIDYIISIKDEYILQAIDTACKDIEKIKADNIK